MWDSSVKNTDQVPALLKLTKAVETARKTGVSCGYFI